MVCISPILLKNENRRLSKDYATNQVPCGKCLPCLQRRQLGWVYRLKEELKSAKNGAFLTLTYDNDNLPLTEQGLATLNKRDFQLFIKRLRKAVTKKHGNDFPIKYYACGEYGSQTLRPHYHAIIFNIPKDYILRPALLANHWGLGHITLDPPDPATMAYVTKYIMKQEKWDKAILEGREPEFQLQSKGLGKTYLTKEQVEFYKRQKVPYLIDAYGNPYPMPRYYKDKLYTEDEKMIVNLKAIEHLEANEVSVQKELLNKEYVINKHKRINRNERNKM